MKVLLICAGGMSSSILMRKMREYAAAQGMDDFEIEATGLGGYKKLWPNYDCILMGPQVGYRKDFVAKDVDIPVEVTAPLERPRQLRKRDGASQAAGGLSLSLSRG